MRRCAYSPANPRFAALRPPAIRSVASQLCRRRALAAAASAAVETRPGATFSIELSVRDYELDQYGVVNNATIASYLQHARHEWFKAIGHDADEFARSGEALATTRQSIHYLGPLRSRDRFKTTVRVGKLTGVRAVLHQEVVKVPCSGEEEEQTVAKGESECVYVGKTYKPRRIPEKYASSILTFTGGPDIEMNG